MQNISEVCQHSKAKQTNLKKFSGPERYKQLKCTENVYKSQHLERKDRLPTKEETFTSVSWGKDKAFIIQEFDIKPCDHSYMKAMEKKIQMHRA